MQQGKGRVHEGSVLQSSLKGALARADREAIAGWVSDFVSAPPEDGDASAVAISPLFQSDPRGPRSWPIDAVFPKLLEGLGHPSLAAVVLDLANYLVHRGRVTEHPARSHASALIGLLGGVVDRLGRLQEDPRAFGTSVAQVQRVLHEGVSLAVSLCDALGLIGDASAEGKLQQAASLAHRRIQVEATAALARLGIASGKSRLMELAAEPTARLRVLAYAEELGLLDDVAEAFRSDEGRAIAQLATWLAEPQQFGLPPQDLEVIDQRTQFWPSYEQPQACYLIRFRYALGERSMHDGVGLTNIGISGPLVHAMEADLGNLPVDDIYAIYAGWQAAHDEIHEVPRSDWNPAQQERARWLEQVMEDQGVTPGDAECLGIFFDDVAWIGVAQRLGTEGVCVCDGSSCTWFPTAGRPRPLSTADAWNLYKGRRMLRTFNVG
jgi:hypothetical protein